MSDWTFRTRAGRDLWQNGRPLHGFAEAIRAIEDEAAALDADILTMAMDHVDMAAHWIKEPRDISDPPGMERMTFDRAGYAHDLAAEYNRHTVIHYEPKS